MSEKKGLSCTAPVQAASIYSKHTAEQILCWQLSLLGGSNIITAHMTQQNFKYYLSNILSCSRTHAQHITFNPLICYSKQIITLQWRLLSWAKFVFLLRVWIFTENTGAKQNKTIKMEILLSRLYFVLIMPVWIELLGDLGASFPDIVLHWQKIPTNFYDKELCWTNLLIP